MSAGKQAPSFDDIIQAGRARAKNAALANEIFGRGRKSNSAQSKDQSKKTPVPGSLASRITPAGVGKRSASASSLKQNKVPSRPASAATQKARAERISASMFNNDSQTNLLPSNNKSKGISIRGISSGPFFVQASNFAPGTTAADIEAAIYSMPFGASEENLQSCRIITNSPTVIAEVVFTDRSIAEQLIESLNGQKADGRVLHVHLKNPPTGPRRNGNGTKRSEETQPDLIKETMTTKEVFPDAGGEVDTAMNDVEQIKEPLLSDVYEDQRVANERDRETRLAEPQVEDGTYGFEEPTEPPREPPRHPSYRGDRDDRDRGYDRNRNRYDDRNGRYGDRYERTDSYRRDDYPPGNNFDRRDVRRDPRPPFHNGGGGGRGGWGGDSRGGRGRGSGYR
ncbi:hypothetical protein UCRPC4_g05591 [Phaeomoniella chlamydospora]|uniref:RRM domain-containing protein n=1 Tax=Phaeomoniella chlamydospora TaxID=158046 RepID=A0A0G2E405_PHACM|nr:hypothetical protein UCRPC4_g05591 [Phaeomoniella chlamydospora]